MNNRVVLSVKGSDRHSFLQGLVTNDVKRARDGIIYTALLTPQGKLITDFFVVGQEDALLIDVAAETAPTLFQRLSMYKLRADVQITETELVVSTGLGAMPDGAVIDPRGPQMGWRYYGQEDIGQDIDWDAQRVAHGIPELGRELNSESYILEMGFERLNGVDFKKGCYVGQEVTARMKHKTELRKGLRRITLSEPVIEGTPIHSGEKEAGTVHTVSGREALAYLRFDRISDDMTAGAARVTVLPE